jgi:acyl dehydratase
VNLDYAGREYPPNAVYSVGREKVREFADAVGATHAHHHDVGAARAAGYRDVVAPPTFAVVVAQRAEAQYIQDPAAGIDFARVVHADERFAYRQPIVAGDELTTVLHVDSLKQRAGITFVTTRCEIFVASDAGGAVRAGEPVVTVTSTLAVRGEDA